MIGGDASLAAMMLSRGELDWVGVDATQAQVARRTERLRESLEAVPAVTTPLCVHEHQTQAVR